MASKSRAVEVESTPLVDTISYLLWRLQSELAHAWQRQGERELTRHRVTFDLLLLLGIYPGISQSDLARALVMDKSNTATLVRSLQQRRWLARRSAPEDARRLGLFLTPDGVHQLALMRQAYQRHEEGLIEALGSADAAALVELLQRAVAAAQAIPAR
jgi:DNA-binding MarR family transcriptional regulator